MGMTRWKEMNREVDMQLKQLLLLFTLESAADTGNTR